MEIEEVVKQLEDLGFIGITAEEYVVVRQGENTDPFYYVLPLKPINSVTWYLISNIWWKYRFVNGAFYYWEDKWIPCDPSITDIPTLMVLYGN